MSPVLDLVTGHRRLLAFAWLLAVAVGASQLGFLRIDNSLAVWDLGVHDPAEDRYRKAFGDGELLIFAFETRGDPFTPDEFEHLRRVHQELEKLSCSKEVLSLWGYFRDSRGWEPGDPVSPDDLAGLREEVEASPFFDGELISRDRRVLALHLSFSAPTPEALRDLKSSLDRLIEREAGQGRTIHWGGVAAVSMVLDEISREEIGRRFPLGVIAGCVVGWLAGIPVTALLALLFVAASTVALTMGSLVLLGQTMNMVLSILPSMVFFMTMAYGVHVVHCLAEPRGSEARERSLRAVARPLRDASITTALGLLSQLTSDFPVLRTMGLHGALGVMAGVAGGYLLLPLLLGRVGPCELPLSRLPLPAPSNPRWGAWAALVLATILGTTQVETRMDPLEFLPGTHPLSTSFQWIESRLTGLSPFDLVLESEESLATAAGLSKLQELGSEIGRIPGVTDVIGAVDVLRRFHQNARALDRVLPEDYRLPQDPAEIARFMEAEAESGQVLSRFVLPGGRSWRIHVRTTAREAGEFERMRESVLEIVRRDLPGVEASVRGSHARIKRMEGYLLESQFRSLLVSWILVSFILLARAPSLRIGLLAIPPNTIPLLLVFATMGFGGIPLDIGTVMVTSLAAGMAVDDTFHYLDSYRRWREKSSDRDTAIHCALEQEGPAVIQTALFTGALFVSLTTSSFRPVAHFGFLSLVAVSGGILLDLTLLPALLRRFEDAG